MTSRTRTTKEGPMIRRSAPIVLAAALLAPAAPALAAEGLTVSPAIVQHTAARGDVGTVTVRNTTAAPLRVTVTPRPWRQSRSGRVAADRTLTLTRYVQPSAGAFVLGAGGERRVALSMSAVPARGALFGALDVVGLPTKKKKSGITAGYRLVGSLRLTAPAAKRTFRVRMGALEVRNSSLSVAVRGLGNTIDPTGGTVRLSGPGGTRTVRLKGVSIVPGQVVNLPIAARRTLAKGTYKASIQLTQAGRTVASGSRAIRLR